MSNDTLQAVQAHCFKCKTRRNMQSPRAVYTKTGRPASKGACPTCGANLLRIGKTAAHENLPKPDSIEKPAPKESGQIDQKQKNENGKKETSPQKHRPTRHCRIAGQSPKHRRIFG